MVALAAAVSKGAREMSARQDQLLQAQKTVEQLRTQANLERTKVSVSSKRWACFLVDVALTTVC